MRHSSLLKFCAALMALFVAGCGGGSGTNATVTGIWTGTATQTRAVGDKSTIQFEFVQVGGGVSGTAIINTKTISTVGSLNGTINGNQVNATINNGSGSTASVTGTVSGTAMTGTYATNDVSGSAGGTFTATQATGVTTAMLNASTFTWTGTYTVTGGTAQALSLTMIQNQDALSLTGSLAGSSATATLTGSGGVIGNNVTLIVSGVDYTLYLVGVYNGTSITGTTQDSQGHSGAFTLSPAS